MPKLKYKQEQLILSEINNQVIGVDYALNKYHDLSMFQAAAGRILEAVYRRST